MAFEFSNRSLVNMQGVHPDIIFTFVMAISHSPIDFGIPSDGGVRTAARQNEMYLDPEIKTKCDGYKNKSNHQIGEHEQYGMALDLYAYINKAASWGKGHLSLIAGVILSTNARLIEEGKIKVRLTWGGTFDSNDFDGWDKPHFEGVLI